MNNSIIATPKPANEPVRQYAPGSHERAALERKLERMATHPVDIPLFIGGQEIRTGNCVEIKAPHDRSLTLGRYHLAGDAEIAAALEAGRAASAAWAALPYEERAAVFLKASARIAAGYRYTLNAATMLGQSKNAYQAEIDSACETADFYRYLPHFAEDIYRVQPRSDTMEWNRMEYRPLEGFVYAVTPFNFTAIAANLAAAPAVMGNVVFWKPASSSVLSNWYLMDLLRDCGLPAGVVNFVPGRASRISELVLGRSDFAGLHFTGSTATFNALQRTIASNLDRYRSYPRVVGETGGKDFIFLHQDCDEEAAVVACLRGAFEYQGQKCSAASRVYVPASRAKAFVDRLVAEVAKIKVGDVRDHSCFMNAVIDEAAFDSIVSHIERAKADPGATIVAGGIYDKSKGFFVEPTVVVTKNPRSSTMVEEIFGPVLTVHAYDDRDLDAAYALVDSTSPYALTGAVFARDRGEIEKALRSLGRAAGNFYVNDKPTGAVVGRQPFGGARGSGTNDKAGSFLNLMRWVSPRAVKETFCPPRDWTYPFMQQDART